MRDEVVKLAPFGAAATPRIRTVVTRTYEALKKGTLHPFTGPIRDQKGRIRIPAGTTPGPAKLQTTNYLVRGVIGKIAG